MIDIELVREKPEWLRERIETRGDEAPIARILELDARRREIIVEADALRARRNLVSREIGQMKGKPPQELIEEMREVGSKVKGLESEQRSVDQELSELLLTVPNPPADDAPVGEDDADNPEVRRVGEMPTFDFEPKPHWELGERLDVIDFERGVKLAKSRFFTLKGKGARLHRALISWMVNLHTEEHGYEELYLPVMVSSETATGSGHLPKFADTMYHDDEDDLWFTPTAETAITNLYRGEILPPGLLPINHVAHTPCFRRERAAAGKDTRGIKRLHQFEKVEMYKFVEPDRSADELLKLLADAEDVCARLGLPYQVVELCTGDLAFSAVKGFDVNVWAAGSEEWLEVSSCSNCTDFQARRSNTRYRPEPEARPRFMHTLNGSGLGVPRVLIALMENNQQADGSIVIPEVLRPYTGFDVID
jgi:seryl-tRNA synthetase